MQTTTLGPFTVSRLCLGTMLMGDKTPREESHRMLDRFLDAGGNFVDTADTYSDGGSEETLAPWLARRRDEVVLATKCRFPSPTRAAKGSRRSGSRRRATRACGGSGSTRSTSTRSTRPIPDVPLEETLAALDALVRAGKVRALGVSNFPAWLLAWSVALQDREGWAPFVSLQPQYSLVERSIEVEILPFCRAAGLGVIPWGPLGAGFLTGRYKRGERPPEGSRIADADETLEEAYERRATERHFRVVDAAGEIAEAARRHDPAGRARMAARDRGRDGADRRPAHVRAARGPARRRRARARRATSARDSRRRRGPPAGYPQRFLREQNGIGEVRRLVRAR